MNIEKMYSFLKERYQDEQEKQVLKLATEKANQEKQEKEAKKELGILIPAIIDSTKSAIEAIPDDMLYQAYEECQKANKHNCRSKKEDIVNLLCYSENNRIYFTLSFNDTEIRLSKVSFHFDRSSYMQLFELLKKSYKGIIFGSYNDTVIFSFNEGTITLEFSLILKGIYENEDDEKVKEETIKNSKRLISDIKEIFPDVKTSRRGYQRDSLFITIKLY